MCARMLTFLFWLLVIVGAFILLAPLAGIYDRWKEDRAEKRRLERERLKKARHERRRREKEREDRDR